MRGLLALLLVGRVAAQLGSPARDKAALLAFKADGNTGNTVLSGWTDESEPCAADSWNSRAAGWVGVMCDTAAPKGRVTVVYLPNAGLTGNVESLAALSSIRLMSLKGNADIYGDVATLDRMGELRQLRLGGTAVAGDLGRAATGNQMIWIRNPWGTGDFEVP